jgi:hypothetical protein
MTTQGNKGNRAREAGRNKIRQLGLKQQRKNREAEIAKIIEQLERYEVSGLRRVPFGIKKSKDQLLKEFKNLMGIDYRDYRGITQRYSTEDEGTSRFDLRGRGRGSELDAGRNIPLTSSKQKNKKPIPFLNEKKILGEGMPSPLTSKQRLDTVQQNVNKMSPEEISASRKRTQAIPKKLRNDMRFGGPQDPMPYVELEPELKPDRDRLERSIKSAPEDKNIVEQLVSKLLGRNIRFEDIPDDDPDFDQGLKSEGHIAYPAGRPDLRMGGMTARSAATTKFKKPLGMMGGGNITRAQRQRIARIMQDYKQKKARKSNGKRTNR